jgi:triosephosphate isomerase (TIM)
MQIKIRNKNKKVIIGSWKLQIQNLKNAKNIFNKILKNACKFKNTQILIAPPVLYLNELKNIYKGNCVKLCAQNVFENEDQKIVGETSVQMLKNLGNKYAIVGHPSQRLLNKNTDKFNEIINKKIKLCLENNINIIFCIGEIQKDNNGNYLRQIKKQIHWGLSGVNKKNIDKIFFTYDPAWIKEKPLDSEQLNFMIMYIKKIIIEIFGKSINKFIKILYGGSVNKKSAQDLLKNTQINGFIIGRSSIDPKKFTEILHTCNSI